jgi:hypothetical protein
VIIESRGARAGLYGPSLIHTYIRTYIHIVIVKLWTRLRVVATQTTIL